VAHLLGVDIGTSRVKALLLDENGAVQGLSTATTPFRSRAGGVDMEAEALKAAVAEALSGLGESTSVCAVGVAGMAEAGAPLDSAGRPLAPVMAWHDPRGQDAVDRLRQQFGGDELDRRIGHRLRTVSSVAKMGWLADHGGLDGAAVWLGVPELVVHALTGAQVTEHSLASRTGCYDVAARNWLPEVAEGAGLPATALPEVRAAGTAMGRVTGPGGQWSGLPAGIPVTLAGHDHLAGAEGVGAEPGDALDSMGTAETVLRRTPRCRCGGSFRSRRWR
jgi:xylulokinase